MASDWIRLPGVYDDIHALDLGRLFDAHEVVWGQDLLPLGAHHAGGHHRRLLRVRAEHIQTAARLIRDLYDLHDPAGLEPYSGPCPACAHDVVEAFACPACELSFHAPADDPLIQFVKEHGGFGEG